jgi:uncharacterized protein (TIGR03067 family)
MKQKRYFFLVLAILVAAAGPRDEAAKQEMAKLEGNWKTVLADAGGKLDGRLYATLSFVANKFARTFKSQTVRGHYEVNPASKPKTIDISFDDGPDKGKTVAGIYALEGENLRICYAEPGKARPTEIGKHGGPNEVLLVLKRDKSAATSERPPPSVFVDRNLETAVRAALLEPKGELTEEKLGNLSILEAPGKRIRDLTGLELCKNVLLIRLSNNEISNLTPIKELTNIQSLDLAGNQIADITPISGLVKLQYLELSSNQISKLDSLAKLTALTTLYLSRNRIADMAPLGSLTRLWSLSLAQNQISDISALSKITKLSTLDLTGNQIRDLGPLAQQSELSLAMLQSNQISDLEPLVGMVKKDAAGDKRMAPYLRLYLSGNPLSEPVRSSQIPALKNYGVRVEY